MELGLEEDEDREEEERPLVAVGNIFARSIRFVSATETIDEFCYSNFDFFVLV